jgi:hypothetical protein
MYKIYTRKIYKTFRIFTETYANKNDQKTTKINNLYYSTRNVYVVVNKTVLQAFSNFNHYLEIRNNFKEYVYTLLNKRPFFVFGGTAASFRKTFACL